MDISTHILTKRMTARQVNVFINSLFQLTSSRRGWRVWITFRNNGRYFNSHPHEEDDHLLVVFFLVSFISTHILTKRMTYRTESRSLCFIFQLTSSRRGWLWCCLCSTGHYHFNSHPHEEDDLFRKHSTTAISLFQLTSSRRGWRNRSGSPLSEISFQLTSSRRGWRRKLLRNLLFEHFNSHPHEEDDSNFKQK